MEIISPVAGQVRGKVGAVKGKQESKRTRVRETRETEDIKSRTFKRQEIEETRDKRQEIEEARDKR